MTKKLHFEQEQRSPRCAPGENAINVVAQECNGCRACMEECLFLREQGTPGLIATKALRNGDDHPAFSCSLCQLCTQICPQQLPIAQMFLDLRRQAVSNDRNILKSYRPLRFYEALGGSSLLKQYFIPKDCDTVFFPGCTLPGIRPKQTEQLFMFMQKKFSSLGLVLDCCLQSSHNLGDHAGFTEKKDRIIKKLKVNGIRHVITSCPSCYQVFQQYGAGIKVSMAYSHLADVMTLPETLAKKVKSEARYTVHDPCISRFNSDVQQDVRMLISLAGGTVIELAHAGVRTLCCGEGGGVGLVKKKYKLQWQQQRKAETGSLPMITYCAGCTVSLHSASTMHILDLIFPGSDKPNKRVKQIQTYFNRLFFKRKMSSYFKSCKT
ncbi:MAG: hypothetical protein COA36_11230 [Desulfotalea sp.]|nr:MAG: hypothetical protein COA36_11230 [Desulfotalea sp.]